jgi:hypothetical protein
MSVYADFEENRVKHLEMIQAVISRLGTNSFLVKGWAVTVSGAFLGFAVAGKEWGLALAGLLPVVMFWYLDAYFLRAERFFRALHEAVRTGSPAMEPFVMAATHLDFGESPPDTSWSDVLFSNTLFMFYGALGLSAVIVLAAILIS